MRTRTSIALATATVGLVVATTCCSSQAADDAEDSLFFAIADGRFADMRLYVDDAPVDAVLG